MRAVDRGVEVTIITRLDLEGDTADFILGAVNKEGVNKFYDKGIPDSYRDAWENAIPNYELSEK
jgi:hypothetical protein